LSIAGNLYTRRPILASNGLVQPMAVTLWMVIVTSLISVPGRLLPVTKGRKQPILLKKSVMASATEEYAPDVEVFTFG